MSSNTPQRRGPKAGMSPLTGKPLPPRPAARRTQAERLAETRARIISATVAYIDDHGFHQTSLHQVARAAGVTVGAVQHHFASKHGLLTAVVEESFQQLTESLRLLAFQGLGLEQRIALFVDQCWAFCNSARYQASLQILLGIRNEEEQMAETPFEQWINQTLGHVAGEGFELWRQVFNDVAFDEAEHFDILVYIFSSLSGSALLSRISQHPARVESDLRELKKLLLLRFREKLESPKPRGPQ